MSDVIQYTKGSKNIKYFFSSVAYKIRFARDNPDYFYPSGIWLFCGPQGSGKTLSAIECLQKMCLEYPKALVVSNIEINKEALGIKNRIIPFVDYAQLTQHSNGIYGIIFVLDEIHVLWNSLESKDIPISEMATFCQMRKDRRVILGTAQVYGRVAKPIREQLQYVIDCKNFFNLVQYNKVIDPSECIEKDGHIDGKHLGTQIWFHTPTLYNSYDTLNKIKKAKRKEQPTNGRIKR